MSTNKTNLSVNSLDFDTIKSNLKTYMQSQDTFKDYNFDGSAMSILLDLLAYNTHYEAFYNNMVANEMFLDSAAKRDSLVSIAKHLGYTPSSPTSSSAVVDIKLGSTAGMSTSTIIPIGSKFSSTKDGKTYNFVNLSTGTVNPTSSDGVHVKSLEVVEGKLGTFTYVYDSSDPDQKFILPDKNIDTSRLTVRVQTSTSDTTGYTDKWNKATTINDVTPTTKVYFLEETYDGFFRIYFGDGVVGSSLTNGNLVIVEYLISSGSVANDIGKVDKSGDRAFSYGSNNEVIVSSAAAGGAERESIASIRSNAPRSYQAQDRAVTSEDFRSILIQDYPSVDSVSVWGGEDNDPPDYGSVYVSFKPSSGTVITQATKDSIANSLTKTRSIVAITPKIVDPNYIYLRVSSIVNYDSKSSSLTEDSLKTLVVNKVNKFNTNNLEKFDKGLRYSKFVKDIDDADPSIISNETSILIENRLEPITGVNSYYTIRFGNKIYHPYDGYTSSLSSSGFKYFDSSNIERDSFLDDDGLGVVRIYYMSNGIKTYINNKAGTIDYETGVVKINNIKINSSIGNSFIRIMVEPREKDVDSITNTILIIDSNDADSLKVTMNSVNVV